MRTPVSSLALVVVAGCATVLGIEAGRSEGDSCGSDADCAPGNVCAPCDGALRCLAPDEVAACSDAGGGGGGNPVGSTTTSMSVGGMGGMGGSSSTTGGGGIHPVGNCVIDAPEECDDCNAVAGDGCDALGMVEPGWACPSVGAPCLHVSGFVEQNEAPAGALGDPSGGSPWERVCAPGTVLVGFTAEDASACSCAGSATRLGSLVPQCAAVTVGPTGDIGWVMPTTLLARVGGNQGVGASLGDLLCAQNELLVGLHGSLGPSYGEVAALAIVCATLSYAGGTFTQGVAATSATLGEGPLMQSVFCPPGTIITSLDGGHGAVIDGMAPSCATPVATFCGDGVVDPHETCDDGNSVSGDGCDHTCRIE